jgi:ribose transport system substrate-binding protein
MRTKAQELGVNLVETNARFDAALQAEQVRDLAAQNLDGLIIMPHDGTAIVPVVAEIYENSKKERGTPLPIFILNAAIDSSGDKYTVGFSGPDDVAMGKAAADLMAQALSGKGNIIEVAGQASPPAILRRKGFADQLAAKYPDMKVIDDQPANWDPNMAIGVTRDMLTRDKGKVNGIYGHDDGLAEGAVEALKAAGYKPGEIPVVGLGAYASGLRETKAGWMYGTVLQDPDMDGALAIETLVKYLRGETIDHITYLAAPIVTKDNVDQITVRF